MRERSLAGWREVTLSQLGEVNRGRSRHRPRYAEHLYGGLYPFIQTGDVKASGGRISEFSQTYNEAGLSQSRLWPAGTMCITIAANIAETGILDFPACFPDSVVGFIADPEKADVRFVEYVFRTLREGLQHEASGSVQDNINLETLSRLKFSVPALTEQQAIAEVLGALDDKIAANKKIADLTVQLARSVWSKMSSGAEKIPLSHVAEIGLSGVWGEDSSIGQAQRQVYALRGRDIEDLARRRPVTPPKRWISSAQESSRVSAHSMEIWTAGSGSQLGPTLLITPEFRQTFDLPLLYSNFVKRLVAKPGREELMPSAWFTMWAEWDRNGFENYKTGTAFPNLDAVGLLRGLTVPLLDKHGLDQTKSWADLILCSELIDENRTLAATRDTLLPQLMTGKLRIKDAEKILESVGA